MPFDAATRPDLTGAALDRAAHLRENAAALARLRESPEARTLVFSGEKPLFQVARDSIALDWRPLDDPLVTLAAEPPVLLGLMDGAPRYAALIGEAPYPEGSKFIDLRSALLGGDFAGSEAAVAAMAKALTGWHSTHPHCARCGARSTMVQGGWRRDCPACDAQHFPRTDPIVIMVVEREGRCAIARNVNFPEGFYSLIAGFVEPGESIEEAVRRETLEELGLRVGRVAYASSQPWPFPAGLMIGCVAETLDTDFTLEEAEIADARWLDRADLAAWFRGETELALPRKAAIASTLLRDWLDGRIGFT